MLTDNNMQIFRVTRRYWINGAGSESLVLLVFAALFLVFAGKNLHIPSFLMLFLGIVNVGLEINTTRTAQIVITKSEISMQYRRYMFQAKWESIKVAQFAGAGKEMSFIIHCEDSGFMMPMKYFDEEKLTTSLKQHLPIEVFEPFAYRRLPQFQEHQQDVIKKVSKLTDPLKVSLGVTERWLGIIIMSLGLVLAIVLYYSSSNATDFILAGGILGGLGLLTIIFSAGWIEATNESIAVRTLFSRHKLHWATLEKLYIQRAYGWMTLISGKSRLILPNPSTWRGKDKDLLQELMGLKLETLEIEPVETDKVMYWRSKIYK